MPSAMPPASTAAAAARPGQGAGTAAPQAPTAAPMSPQPATAPLDLGAIGTAAAARAAGRTLRRPGFWIAVAVLVVVVTWFFLR